MPVYLLPLLALLYASAFMVALWIYQLRRNDASIVDLGWSLSLGLIALLYGTALQDPLLPRIAVVAVACPWSFRLAWHLYADRVKGRQEDGRYRALREQWGASAPKKFFIFFQVQALLAILFSLPFLVGMLAGSNAVLLLVGVLWGWLAILGERTADRQLRTWRSNPATRGKTCRTGLWRYSRHPNYFFEWLHWWAYVLICLPSPWALVAVGGPLLMALFLFRVTGIPYTEAQALRSRGEDYRAYQRETSAFFPWFPKRGDT